MFSVFSSNKKQNRRNTFTTLEDPHLSAASISFKSNLKNSTPSPAIPLKYMDERQEKLKSQFFFILIQPKKPNINQWEIGV